MFNQRGMYNISRFLLISWVKTAFKVRFSGLENVPKPPFIAASNHASLIDPPLLSSVCSYPVDFMAKTELFQGRIIGKWTRIVGCIEVKRGDNSVSAIKEALRRLKEGRALGIFPEGTRSEDGSLQDAKRGMGFLIAKAKVPVVPCYISGSSLALPKGKPIAYGTRIDVIVGKAIMPEEFAAAGGIGKKDYGEMSQMVMDRIADIKEKFGTRTNG